MDPAVARSTFERAIGLHRQGRTAEAEQLYRQVLIWEPSQFPVQYMLAAACHQQQKWLEALAAIDAALALDPLSVDALMLQGTLLLQNQCNEQSLVVFTALSERTPNRADVWHSVGAVLARLERHEEAVAAFDKALGLKQTAESWNDRGVALQRINRLQEAAISFDRALAFGTDVRFAYNRACALLQLRCFGEALAAFDAVLTQDPSSFDAWNDRGAALEGLGRDEAALASYDHALTMRPEFAQAWYNRGGVLHRLSRFADAVSSYDKLLAITPGHIDGWKNRGAALHKLGDFELAIDCYRRVTELRPDDITAWNEVAGLLQFQQRYKDALEYSDQTLALQRDYPPALRTRSLILWESGCIAEGMAFARRHADLIQATLPAFFEEDSPHKTRHDAEQADYLAGQGVRVVPSILHIVGGERLEGAAINHGDTVATVTLWRNNHPQVVVIDDFLTPEALAALREFTWGSTIWRKPYKNGYLGAMPEHGFSCPLLAQIAEELCAKFPDIFHGHGLAMLWGFKYDSKLGGIRVHADQAAVNVNFWITPNEANRNPDSGGLLIWDQAAPADWNIARYNGDDEAVRTFLAKTCSKPTKIPYRANRAVIFDSDLFHETDKIEFEEGYLNRRINITMLFGRRTPKGF